jgi:class 3 adenylate cyclase
MRLTNNLAIHRLAMLAVVAIVAMMAGGQPSRIEYALLDLRFAINRAVHTNQPLVEAAVLLVSPESERRLDDVYGSGWRRWYPTMIARLERAGAVAVVWDATFLAGEPTLDPALAQAFLQLPVIAAENGYERNNPVIRPSLAGIGWKQFIVVQSLPRRTVHGTPVPALGAEAARTVSARFADVSPVDISPAEPLWLDFSHDPLTIPTFDIADLILAGEQRLANTDATPLSVFTDRVVFVGTNLPGADRYPIPGTGGEPVAGVLAQVVSMWSHLGDRTIHRVDGWAARALVFVAGALMVAAGSAHHRRTRRSLIALVIAAALVVPPVAFASLRVWLPSAGMLGAVLAASILIVTSQRLQLSRNYRTSLGFDPRLLEDQRVAMRQLSTGVERHAAVLCADVRNYTQFVTDTPPDEVQQVMSRYMSAMESLVHQHGGYINKFVGDEIIAVFGFPLSEDETARRAISTGNEMLLRVRELNAEFSVAGLPVLDGIGVGIDTGTMRFITIGGDRRVQFDVIGAPINGASRLQGLTKQMGQPLIVSAEIACDQDVFAVEDTGAAGSSEDTGTRGGGADAPADDSRASLEFIGEVMIRGQGRRRLFGLPSATLESLFS